MILLHEFFILEKLNGMLWGGEAVTRGSDQGCIYIVQEYTTFVRTMLIVCHKLWIFALNYLE